jgi:hypothetical protein
MKANGEFRLQFADHVQRHLRNGGALTPEVRLPRYTQLADLVRAAIILEEARWDLTTVNIFENEVADRTANWFPNRSQAVLDRLRSESLFPRLDAPVFSQHGGSVSPGTPVTMETDADTIYYTLDGSDPRLFRGAPAPAALAATLSGGGKVSDPLFFSAPTTLKARSFNSVSGEWSALNEAFFSIDSEPAGRMNLVISEIHYHPAEPRTPAETAVSRDRDDYEFIELFNPGAKAVDLTGVVVSGGISFGFADHTILPAGARLVLVRDLTAFTARYGPPAPGLVGGEYSGRLSNDGEQVTLARIGQGTLHDLTYNDQPPWPVEADGSGYALVLLAPERHPDHALPASWAAGSTIGGTPGGAN